MKIDGKATVEARDDCLGPLVRRHAVLAFPNAPCYKRPTFSFFFGSTPHHLPLNDVDFIFASFFLGDPTFAMADTQEIWKLDHIPPATSRSLVSSFFSSVAALQNNDAARLNITEQADLYDDIVKINEATFDEALAQSRTRFGHGFRHRALFDDFMSTISSASQKAKLLALHDGIQRATAVFFCLASTLSVEHTFAHDKNTWEKSVRDFIEELTPHETIAVKAYVRLMGRISSGNLADDIVACGALPAKMKHLSSVLSSLPGAPGQEKPATEEQKREIYWIFCGGLGSCFVRFVHKNRPDFDANETLETLGPALWEWMASKGWENKDFDYKGSVWRFLQGCLEAAVKKLFDGKSLSTQAPTIAYGHVSEHFMAYRDASASGERGEVWRLSKQLNRQGEAIGKLHDGWEDLKQEMKAMKEQNAKIEGQNSEIQSEMKAMKEQNSEILSLLRLLQPHAQS
ncbi:MAG: hypothetical protein ABW189_08355 [Rickettsiales bacterium]